MFRYFPYIIGLFTIGESYLVSLTCGMFPAKLVLIAGLLTLSVTLALTVYAMTTK